MAGPDDFSSGLIEQFKDDAPRQQVGQFSHDLIAQTREKAKGEVDPLVLDETKDWDFARELLDSASFGALSRVAPEHIQDARKQWVKGNSGKAAAAQVLGQTVPEMAASTLLGQGEFVLAGKLARLPELARFLTGSSEGNALMRLASHAAWGAQQGLVTAGMENVFGRPASYTGAAAVGAGMGPASNLIFAPLHSAISPEVAQFARDYLRETGGRLNLAQIPGAPYAARAAAKLMRMGREDLPGLTSSIMRSAGLDAEQATDATLAQARDGIRQRLQAAVPSSNATGLTDAQTSQLFDQLGNIYATGTSPQAQAVRLAQHQWINSQKVERMIAASGRPDGLIDPDVAVREIRSQATGYPGGIGASAAARAAGAPVDLGLLARGADIFQQQTAGAPHIGAGAGLGLGGLLAGAHEYIEPLLHTALPYASLALGAGAAYSAAGALMDNPLYLNLLLRGGGRLGPAASPLIPLATEWTGNRMDLDPRVAPMLKALSPITPAQGASLGEITPYASRLFQLESDWGRDPGTFRGENVGLGQFGPEEMRRYGITDPRNEDQQLRAVALEQQEHSGIFQRQFGRAPTPGELYLMHQQGASGGPALLAGGDTPAWQAVRQFYPSDRVAQKAISGNLPTTSGLDPSTVTARQFANYWVNHFESGLPGGVQIAPGPTSAGFTSVLQTPPDQLQNLLAGSQ